MLFITNRDPIGSKTGRLPRAIRFDLKDPEPTAHGFFCERGDDGSFVEIGSNKLFAKLQHQDRKHVLLFIHGFNVEMPDALQSADDLQRACDHLFPDGVVVVPLIWPSMGKVLAYWDDQDSAEASAKSFARVLARFMAWRDEMEAKRLEYIRMTEDQRGATEEPKICDRRISLLSHSMGNRVLRFTLAQVFRKTHSMPFMFRNVFMVAADIVNESLERGEDGRLISDASRNVVVYHAADDLALRGSKASNLSNGVVSRRLGHSGPEDMNAVARRVYAVDCCGFNNSYDDPLGHSYYVSDEFQSRRTNDPGAVMRHIAYALRTGRVDIPHSQSHVDPQQLSEPRSFQMEAGYRAPG
ncbi:MAG: alpha/beta hydrolase [Pseudomonadota bacterium]